MDAAIPFRAFERNNALRLQRLVTAMVMTLASACLAGDDSAARTPDDYPLGVDSQVQNDVPRGKLTKHSWTSKIYPGVARDYWLYVPNQYSASKPACVMVFQDGWVFADPNGAYRTPTVFDNLIASSGRPTRSRSERPD